MQTFSAQDVFLTKSAKIVANIPDKTHNVNLTTLHSFFLFLPLNTILITSNWAADSVLLFFLEKTLNKSSTIMPPILEYSTKKTKIRFNNLKSKQEKYLF